MKTPIKENYYLRKNIRGERIRRGAEYAHMSVSGANVSVSGANLSVSGANLSVSGAMEAPIKLRSKKFDLSLSGACFLCC